LGLWLSLALNLFLVALIGAHLLRAADHSDPPRTLDGAIEHIASVLPASDARQFRTVMLEEKPHYQPAHDRMEKARQDFTQAISRNPYDQQAAQSAMKTWQTNWNDFMQKFGDSFLRATGTLSPDGRARLAAFAEHRAPDRRQ
jgi:uncharacterized membrane protein